jgi:hypothetical protein
MPSKLFGVTYFERNMESTGNERLDNMKNHSKFPTFSYIKASPLHLQRVPAFEVVEVGLEVK